MGFHSAPPNEKFQVLTKSVSLPCFEIIKLWGKNRNHCMKWTALSIISTVSPLLLQKNHTRRIAWIILEPEPLLLQN